MAIVRLRIDISGTVGDEAWRNLKHFGEAQAAFFGPEFGSSGSCTHSADTPHPDGEWQGAEVLVATSLLGQYAMSHYLEQDRVLDADVEE
ncbi:MAG TPA: hypothetical protein VG892_12085 [Terriglobales bacterium]|nr:hypothetical protein [Terriglobales bacterium]